MNTVNCKKGHELRNDAQALIGWLFVMEDALLDNKPYDTSLSNLKIISGRIIENIKSCASPKCSCLEDKTTL